MKSFRDQLQSQSKHERVVKVQPPKPEREPQTEKQKKALIQHQCMKELLMEKGIRISDDYLAENYNADEFITKLSQQARTAHVIPHMQSDKVIEIKIKSPVFEKYKHMYLRRLYDLQQWFERKINYQKQSPEQWQDRWHYLEKHMIAIKQQLKITDQNEKFDTVFDTQEVNSNNKQLAPTVLIVTQNVYRCLDFEQIFKSNSQAYTFFTRHYPIQAVVEMINQNIFQNCKFIIGTTSRIVKLISMQSLSMDSVKHLIVDCGYIDDQDRKPTEFDLARSDLRVILSKAQPDSKIWIL